MAVLHDLPVCHGCFNPIEHSPVFAPPCGQQGHGEHRNCASSVWHGLCLMKYRDTVEHVEKRLRSVEIPREVAEILRSLGIL